MRFCPAVIVALLVAGCASQSGNAPTTEPAVAPARVVAASHDPASDAGSPSRALDDKVEELARQYKVVELEGQTKYCKKQKPLGTRIAETVCLTRDDLYRLAEQEMELRTGWRKPKVCAAECNTDLVGGQ